MASTLLLEESVVRGEILRTVASHWHTLSHKVVLSTSQRAGSELSTLVVKSTDCTFCWKFNYHPITTTMGMVILVLIISSTVRGHAGHYVQCMDEIFKFLPRITIQDLVWILTIEKYMNLLREKKPISSWNILWNVSVSFSQSILNPRLHRQYHNGISKTH